MESRVGFVHLARSKRLKGIVLDVADLFFIGVEHLPEKGREFASDVFRIACEAIKNFAIGGDLRHQGIDAFRNAGAQGDLRIQLL